MSLVGSTSDALFRYHSCEAVFRLSFLIFTRVNTEILACTPGPPWHCAGPRRTVPVSWRGPGRRTLRRQASGPWGGRK